MSYYHQWNSQDEDDFNDKEYGNQNQNTNSSMNSSSDSNTTESDFNEDSSSDSNDSADEEFDFKPSRKSAKKAKLTTTKQPNQRSSSKKSQKDTYSSEVKKPKKEFYDDSDSDSSIDFDQYSDSFESGGIANRERSRRNTAVLNYNEDEDDQDDSTEEGDFNEETKEEYTGPTIERIIGTEIKKQGEKRQYYCKYKYESYIHCKWLTSEQLKYVHNGTNALKKWKREKKNYYGLMEGAEESVNNLQILNIQRDDIINPEYFEVFRVIAYDSETNKYLIQWSASKEPDDEFTWEFGEDIDSEAALSAFHKREAKYEEVKYAPKTDHRIQSKENYIEYSEANHNIPLFKDGLELRDYQLVGLNWLRKCWYEHQSSILADEMGLGKTVQGVCMVNEIFKLGFRGPFLAIAPKSTLMQWEREFHSWTDLNVVRYSEGKKAREIIRKYELYWTTPEGENDERYEKFEVMLMNYEKLVIPDVKEIVQKFTWEYVIVDEAHRLKNSNNKTYKFIEGLLEDQKIKHILLMTGTPMQNHPSEIWGLLHLIDPDKFNNLEEFEREFDNNENTKALQQIIAPYMLRRVKDEVEKTIGTKEENIVEVELSITQRKLYRKALEKNASQASNSNYSTNNVKMQLRKVCNHPYLLQEPKTPIDLLIDESEKSENRLDQLVHCCGKMLFVDKLLTALRKDKSNKVLIFSQMTQILDIFQDYCSYRQYNHERIDGQVKGNKRQQAMDRFNDPRTDTFIFLLCTKAGGQGLNLTAANYVIIYDSDWNPQNDIQAQARCHRIGQKNKVEVFRLVSRGTYETKMLKESLNKMKLDQAIEKKASENKQEDIRYIIRFDLESYDKSPIDQLFEDKITIKSLDELDENLESEVKEGDIDDREFMKELEKLQKQNELLEDSRSKRKRRKLFSSDEETYFDDDDLPPDFKVQKVKTALLRYGWGKWDKIKNLAFQDSRSVYSDQDITNFASIVLYAMLYPMKDKPENISNFQEITGLDGIDQNQQKLVKRLLRDHKLHEEFIKHNERNEKDIFEVKLFNDFFDSQNPKLPYIELQQSNIPWSPTDDWDIIKFIQEDGWENWKQIAKDICAKHEIDINTDEFKKFIKKRFHEIFINIDGFKEFAHRFNISIRNHGDKEKRHRHGDGHQSSRERRKREHERKKLQRKQEEENPHITKLKLFSRAICLFGEPTTEDQWSAFEHYCNCDDDSHKEDVPKIIFAAHKLLDSKTHDPEYVFDDDDFKEFRYFMKERLADEIAITCQWFDKFHIFYPDEFDESKLSSLDSHPSWWKHDKYDPILFRHIQQYGFSRPYTLIAQPPFSQLIPNALDEVYLLADKEENNDHSKFEPPSITPLEILVQKSKLMSHVDLIINDIRNEKLPLINLKIDQKDIKMELPRVIDGCYIESIGTGDFKAIDGYLYKQGFSSRAKFNNKYYNCFINTTSYMPFQVQEEQSQREYSGKTPYEAFSQALEADIDTDTYKLFGIGIPVVRYWLQQDLGEKRVSGYRSIQFEIVAKESKKFSPVASSSGLFPKLGIKKKKLFVMPGK